jgi:type I restriction enzyme S subunit
MSRTHESHLELEPYPATKDSGVKWLGEVPEHWEVRRLGQIGRLSKGSGGNKDDEVPTGVPCVRYGDLYTTHTYFISSSRSFISKAKASDYTPIAFGDVLFAASGETIDEIGKSAVNLIESEACCGGDVILFRPEREVDSRYMGYATDCRPAAAQKATMGRGITVMHIYGDELKYLTLALPPLPEQVAIARFLDHINRRIRRYIRAKQKLIRLLEEQKQAIIHRAVTRGLDPNVRFKPSGVDWLGDMPKHWEVRPLTRSVIERADYRGATPEKTDSGVTLVTARNIRKGWIDYEVSKEYVSSDKYDQIMRRGLPQINDLLLTMEAPLGHAALVDREEVAFAQRVVRFRMDPSLFVAPFVLHSVLAAYLQDQLLCRGTGSTAVGIKASKLPQLRLLCPPLDEQRAIVHNISRFADRLDAATCGARREIALLREYRTRLIADVVTGKLDVREAAANLPDEIDEIEPTESLDELAENGEPVDDDLDAEAEEAVA